LGKVWVSESDLAGGDCVDILASDISLDWRDINLLKIFVMEEKKKKRPPAALKRMTHPPRRAIDMLYWLNIINILSGYINNIVKLGYSLYHFTY
jgi:hypothetical protein